MLTNHNLDESKMYTIQAYYPNSWHLPSDTLSPIEAVISPQAQTVNKRPLIQTINTLLDGNHNAIFKDEDRALDVGDVAYIRLKVE